MKKMLLSVLFIVISVGLYAQLDGSLVVNESTAKKGIVMSELSIMIWNQKFPVFEPVKIKEVVFLKDSLVVLCTDRGEVWLDVQIDSLWDEVSVPYCLNNGRVNVHKNDDLAILKSYTSVLYGLRIVMLRISKLENMWYRQDRYSYWQRAFKSDMVVCIFRHNVDPKVRAEQTQCMGEYLNIKGAGVGKDLVNIYPVRWDALWLGRGYAHFGRERQSLNPKDKI